jgi:molecular chaperone GrpE
VTELAEEIKEPIEEDTTEKPETEAKDTEADTNEAKGEEETEEKETSEEKEASEEKETSEEKDGLFKKKKQKNDKVVEELKAKVAELQDRYTRQLAEFQNFRNRSEKEKSQMFDVGSRNVIVKILPIVDNFERGLAALPEEEKSTAFAEGMNMVYKQLVTELDNLGVKPIEAKGKEFDHVYHNAVMQVESDEFESGIVAEELQKGYTYHDTVIRPSMVSVVK